MLDDFGTNLSPAVRLFKPIENIRLIIFANNYANKNKQNKKGQRKYCLVSELENTRYKQKMNKTKIERKHKIKRNNDI